VLKTPLHTFHVDRGGQMVEYAGWELPIRYTGIQEEHRQVRESGGIFDVSHMGRVYFTGRHARRILGTLCSRRISDLQNGQVRYSMICNKQGGVKDDVLVYRLDDTEFMVVCNAANRAKLMEHFEVVRAAGDLKVKIDDRTEKTSMVAIQGPKVMDLISKVSTEVPTLKRYRFTIKNMVVFKLIVSRTGYTGEDGVEVILPGPMTDMALKLLLKDVDMGADDAVIKPAGLGARDSLRLEAGMALYGHELGEEINALACNVGFAINLDKDEGQRPEPFIGQEALKKTRDAGGPDRTVVGIRLEGKRSARQGNTVLIEGAESGAVSSGCMSPTLGYPIAMAFVDASKTEVGTKVTVDTGRTEIEGEIVVLPFYKK